LRAEGIDYTGVIYLGCMLVDERIYLLEINVRMGDPEAEVVLPKIHANFYKICQSILNRQVKAENLELDDLHYCNVVATQGRTRQIADGRNKGWYVGWPYGRFGKHYPVSGLDKVNPRECRVYIGEAFNHPEKGLVTDGGRVLHIVGVGKCHEEAVNNAYRNIQHVQFNGIRYRTDIGRIMPWDGLAKPDGQNHMSAEGSPSAVIPSRSNGR
jgi:phosphoribosylamine--glycine ligase